MVQTKLGPRYQNEPGLTAGFCYSRTGIEKRGRNGVKSFLLIYIFTKSKILSIVLKNNLLVGCNNDESIISTVKDFTPMIHLRYFSTTPSVKGRRNPYCLIGFYYSIQEIQRNVIYLLVYRIEMKFLLFEIS